jgi:hypothetical protein
MNNEIEELKSAMIMLAEELAWTLSHLADPDDIRESDRAHMTQSAERLERLAEALRP